MFLCEYGYYLPDNMFTTFPIVILSFVCLYGVRYLSDTMYTALLIVCFGSLGTFNVGNYLQRYFSIYVPYRSTLSPS